MITRRWILVSIAAVLLPPAGMHAQTVDSLRLGALQHDAVSHDPRVRQLELLSAQSLLRLGSINAERLPAFSANAQGQYQSTVASIPIALPGLTIPAPPHDIYDANLSVRQRVFDPALGGRRNVERAQLAESQARVKSALFAIRQSVNDAYFTTLSLLAQRAEIETVVTDLEAQHRVASVRVKEGAALPSEARILEAEMLRRRQSVAELSSNADAALAVLADLTGHELSVAHPMSLPELASEVAAARGRVNTLRARPEYEQFSLTREVLGRQLTAASARDLPRISAFGRTGYGRPGLNPLASEFDAYWLAGVQLEWTPWNWGTTNRDRQVLSLQQRIVESEEAAFDETLRRSVVRDLATIDRLQKSESDDDAIVALREQVLREARARFGEGVITSAEYVDRQTDVLAARLTRASHRVELAQARARFLTTLGLEVR